MNCLRTENMWHHRKLLLQVLAWYDDVEHTSSGNICCVLSMLCLKFDTLSSVKNVPILSCFFSLVYLPAVSFFTSIFLSLSFFLSSVASSSLVFFLLK